MPLKVGKSEKLMIFIKNFLSSFLQILMFLDKKLQHKIKLSTKSKRKSKNSSIQPRTSRPKFYDFSSNFSKISSFLWRKQAATGRTSPRARSLAESEATGRRRAARAVWAIEKFSLPFQWEDSFFLWEHSFFLWELLFLWEDASSTGRLSFLAVFSFFSSFSYSLFLFSWNHENRSFDAEAGETLEGSFSAISKSKFASKILNTNWN